LFSGPSTTDALAAVLTMEPDWSRLPPRTPPNVRSLLRRCLQKDKAPRPPPPAHRAPPAPPVPAEGQGVPPPRHRGRPARDRGGARRGDVGRRTRHSGTAAAAPPPPAPR